MIFNPIIAGGGTGEIVQATAVAHIKPGSPVYLMTAPHYELTGQALPLEGVDSWDHCAASPDGSMVVASGVFKVGDDETDTVVRLLRVTGDVLSDGGIPPSLPDKSVSSILWSSKGLLLILMSDTAVFYTISGSQLSYVRQISAAGQCAAFSPDGSLLVIGSDLYVVSGTSVNKIDTVPYKADGASVSGYKVNQVSFAPNGDYLYVVKYVYQSGSHSAVDIMRVTGNQIVYLSTQMEGQYSLEGGAFVEKGAVYLANYIWDIASKKEPAVPSLIFDGDTVAVYQQTRIDLLGTDFDGSDGLEESAHYLMTHMGVGIPPYVAASHEKMLCTNLCLSVCGDRGIVGTQIIPQIGGADVSIGTWLPDGRLVLISPAAAVIAKRGQDRLVAGEIMGGLDATVIQGIGTAASRAAPDQTVRIRMISKFA